MRKLRSYKKTPNRSPSIDDIIIEAHIAIGDNNDNFEIPPDTPLIMTVISTAVKILFGILLCRPIRKITAHSLIKE